MIEDGMGAAGSQLGQDGGDREKTANSIVVVPGDRTLQEKWKVEPLAEELWQENLASQVEVEQSRTDEQEPHGKEIAMAGDADLFQNRDERKSAISERLDYDLVHPVEAVTHEQESCGADVAEKGGGHGEEAAMTEDGEVVVVTDDSARGPDCDEKQDTVLGGLSSAAGGDADLVQNWDGRKSAILVGQVKQEAMTDEQEEPCEEGVAGKRGGHGEEVAMTEDGEVVVVTDDTARGPDCDGRQDTVLGGLCGAAEGDADLVQNWDGRKSAILVGQVKQEAMTDEQEEPCDEGVAGKQRGDGEEAAMIEDGEVVAVASVTGRGPDCDEGQDTVLGSLPCPLEDGELLDTVQEDLLPQGTGQVDAAEAGKAILCGGALSTQGLEGLGYLVMKKSDSDSEDEDDDDDEEKDVQMYFARDEPDVVEVSPSDDESSSTSGSSSDEDDHVQVQPVKQDKKAEGKKKANGESSDDDVVDPPRTKNEIAALPPVPKIDVVLQPHHVLQPFGVISSVLGKHIIVQTCGSNSTVANAMNEGSIVWLTKERVPLGFIDEVFGPVKTPYYLVRYNDEADIPEGATESAEVSAVSEFVTYVTDKDPELYKKGYDASGCNDEELSGEEIEFSDDEAEAAYKKTASRKSKSFHGKDESRPGADDVHEFPRFAHNQRDRFSRGRGRGQQRGRSRFDDQQKGARGRGPNNLDDLAVERIADMEIQVPSTSQQAHYNERGRHSQGGQHRGNLSRPPMGRRKFKPRSEGSESEAMSTRTDGSAGSAADEVVSKKSPFRDHGGQQVQQPGPCIPPLAGWAQGNPQGYRSSQQGLPPPNQGFGMQLPSPQGRPPQGARTIPMGGWAPPGGTVNGGPGHGLYPREAYGNMVNRQQPPPLAVGPVGFGAHPTYAMPLADRGFNMAVTNTGPQHGPAGSGGFYPVNAPFTHLPHMLPQQNLTYVSSVSFVPQQPGNIGQPGYPLHPSYPQGGLVYMDNNMRHVPQSLPGGFSAQPTQAAGIMYQQNHVSNATFSSVRPHMSDSFARRGRPGQ